MSSRKLVGGPCAPLSGYTPLLWTYLFQMQIIESGFHIAHVELLVYLTCVGFDLISVQALGTFRPINDLLKIFPFLIHILQSLDLLL